MSTAHLDLIIARFFGLVTAVDLQAPTGVCHSEASRQSDRSILMRVSLHFDVKGAFGSANANCQLASAGAFSFDQKVGIEAINNKVQ